MELPTDREAKGLSPMLPGRMSEQQEATMKLCYAAAAGDPVAVSALLVAGYDADAADYAGKTPLHIACTVNSTGSREVVKVLLEHGVRVNRLDSLGQTPLDICLRARNFEMCRLLEDYGAKVQREELEFKARESFWLLHPEDIKLRKQIGKTLKSAVHLATWRGTRVVVKCAKLHHTSVVRNMAKSKSWVPGAGRLGDWWVFKRGNKRNAQVVMKLHGWDTRMAG